MRRACVLPLPFLIAVIANGAYQAESSPPWLASHTRNARYAGRAHRCARNSNACRCIRKLGRMARALPMKPARSPVQGVRGRDYSCAIPGTREAQYP